MTVLALGLGDLLHVMLVSLAAGVGVTVVFAITILGAVRSTEARRAHHAAAGFGWGAVSLVAGLVVCAAVFAGLSVVAA